MLKILQKYFLVQHPIKTETRCKFWDLDSWRDGWLVFAHVYSFVSIGCAVYFDFHALMILFLNKNIYFSYDFRMSWTYWQCFQCLCIFTLVESVAEKKTIIILRATKRLLNYNYQQSIIVSNDWRQVWISLPVSRTSIHIRFEILNNRFIKLCNTPPRFFPC